MPSLPATARIAGQSEGYSGRTSATIRTARSWVMPWTTTHDLGLTITARPPPARPGPRGLPLLCSWAEEPELRGAFIRTAGFPLAVTPCQTGQMPAAACCTPGTMRSWPNWAVPQSGTFLLRSQLLLTDPYDVEDPDQLRILVEVEAQDAAARPEHGLTEARIISRRPDHRIPGLPG